MFSTQDQKTRRAYAEYWGIEIGDVYYCEICETWTNDDEDGYPTCLCAQGSTLGDTPDAGPPL